MMAFLRHNLNEIEWIHRHTLLVRKVGGARPSLHGCFCHEKQGISEKITASHTQA